MAIDRSHGERFADDDVVRCYAFRPPYPEALFDTVLDHAPGRSTLLDLGTGPGKVIGRLAPHFMHAIGLDPSPEMLSSARRTWQAQTNITWIEATAENTQLQGTFDLVTIAAAVHWMDHAILFPRLARHLSARGRIAVLGGDHARNPPWRDEWTKFMAEWSLHMGVSYEPEERRRDHYAHETWMDIELKGEFAHAFSQSLQGHIECQHSRSIWPRRIMGQKRADAFDKELHALLTPHANNGVLTFEVVTTLAIGKPLSVPIKA